MNNNFNVQLQVQPEQAAEAPYLVWLNSCIQRVEARMAYKFIKPGAQTLNKDTFMEGFRLFIGADVVGTGETNTARLLLDAVLAYEKLVDNRHHLCGILKVNFLGESAEFSIGEFSIMSIAAEQDSSYVEYEVKITLVRS
jgi:hypothetical protein